MDKKLLKLLEEYIEKVNSLKQTMLDDFNAQTKKQLLLEKRFLFTTGQLEIKSDNKYRFHGRGCNFSNKNFEIDWDFGYDDLWCGVNPRLFCYYLETHYKEKYKNYSIDNVEKEIEKMISEGVIVEKHDLYYITESIKQIK